MIRNTLARPSLFPRVRRFHLGLRISPDLSKKKPYYPIQCGPTETIPGLETVVKMLSKNGSNNHARLGARQFLGEGKLLENMPLTTSTSCSLPRTRIDSNRIGNANHLMRIFEDDCRL